MFDHMQKETNMDEMKSSTSTTTTSSVPIKKTCSDCGTFNTPLWRGGPAGPKSLCNACGIRSRKRRRALLGLSNQDQKKSSNKPKKLVLTNRDSSSSTSEISRECGAEKKWCDVRMEGLTWRRSTAGKMRGRRLGEEEQAAVLLMAMAYSSVLA